MNFWEVHTPEAMGILFIVSMLIFPRLTMFFATSVLVGPLAWLGCLFFPRITAAIFAFQLYWDTNPALVVGAIIWAANPFLQSKRKKSQAPQSIGEIINAPLSDKLTLVFGAMTWYGSFLIARGLYQLTGLEKIVNRLRWREFMKEDIKYEI